MKKIKAFFDKSSKEGKEEGGRDEENEEEKEEKENRRDETEVQDSHISSAIAKMPKLENVQVNLDNLPLSGSKVYYNRIKGGGSKWEIKNIFEVFKNYDLRAILNENYYF